VRVVGGGRSGVEKIKSCRPERCEKMSVETEAQPHQFSGSS
jgi:hypothetical protein